jgi:hypothetical protein
MTLAALLVAGASVAAVGPAGADTAATDRRTNFSP